MLHHLVRLIRQKLEFTGFEILYEQYTAHISYSVALKESFGRNKFRLHSFMNISCYTRLAFISLYSIIPSFQPCSGNLVRNFLQIFSVSKNDEAETG